MPTERKRPSVYFIKPHLAPSEEPKTESTIEKINRLGRERIDIYRGLTLGDGGHRSLSKAEHRRLGEIEEDLFNLWIIRKEELAGPRFKEID